jgi:hypothetical protein
MMHAPAGGLGSLPEFGTGYYQSSVVHDPSNFEETFTAFDPQLWEGSTVPVVQDQWEKNDFLKSLEEEEEEEYDEEDWEEVDTRGFVGGRKGGSVTVTGAGTSGGTSGAHMEASAHAETKAEEGDSTPDFNLDESINVWSDFNKVHYHHKTICTLREVNASCDFNNYLYGNEVYSAEEQREEAYDRVRYMVEECDHVQGFHVLADMDSGWGGFAEKLLNDIRDDIGRTAIVSFGNLSSYQYNEERPLSDDGAGRSANIALGTAMMSEMADTYIPFDPTSWTQDSFSSLTNPNFAKDFHSGAIIASVIDTLSLPYRLSGDYNGGMNANLGGIAPRKGLNIAAAGINFPFIYPECSSKSLTDILKDWDPIHEYNKHSMSSLSGIGYRNRVTIDSEKHLSPWSQLGVMRGVGTKDQKFEFEKSFAKYMSRSSTRLQRHYVVNAPLYIPTAYPKWWDSTIMKKATLDSSDDGHREASGGTRDVRMEKEEEVVERATGEEGDDDEPVTEISKVALVASACVTPRMQPVLKAISTAFSRRNQKSLSQFYKAGLSDDRMKEVDEAIMSIHDNYYGDDGR